MKHLCIYFASLVLLLLTLSACQTTGTVIQPHAVEHQIDTINVVKNHVDSVYIKDSIYIHAKGDTIYSERWHTKYKLKYVYRDSIHTRLDSIPYPVEVIKIQKERYIPKYVQALAGLGSIVLITLIAFCIIRLWEAFH